MTTDTTELYYDPYDYDVDVDAQSIWKRLRDEAPVYWNEKFEFYALSLYDGVLAATLDTDTFSSADATTIELMTPEPTTIPMMIWMDPPDHTRFRTLVSRAFTPRAIADLEGRVRRLCATLLDPFVGTARQVGEALAGMTLDALQRWAGGDQEQTLRRSLEFRMNLVLGAIRHTNISTSAGTG
jgi:cytochrome P450